MPFVEIQHEIEANYSRRNIRNVIRRIVDQELGTRLVTWAIQAHMKVENYLNQVYSYASKNRRVEYLRDNINIDSLVIDIACAVLHKHENMDMSYQEASGYLAATLPHETVWDRIKCASELLGICQNSSLYLIKRGNPHLIERSSGLDEELFSWINRTGFNPPMLVEPGPVLDNQDAGYLTIREPVLLGGPLKQHDKPQALDVLEILNKIRWELDTDVLQEQEMPNKPLDSPDKLKAFLNEVKDSQFIYRLLLDNGNKFWFIHQFDTRGRIYQHGYHVHHQSYAYKKASLNFSKQEYL